MCNCQLIEILLKNIIKTLTFLLLTSYVLNIYDFRFKMLIFFFFNIYAMGINENSCKNHFWLGISAEINMLTASPNKIK